MKKCYEFFSHFHAFYVEIHTQFHVFIHGPRSDNVRECVSEQFQSFMLQNDILHQTSYVDSPHNGVAEWNNRHLLDISGPMPFQHLVF